MTAERISVVIPLYNHERYIGLALDSVLSQTRPVDELIVVDDGSSDDSARVVAERCQGDPRLIFWTQANQGAHAAINAGLRRASGDLIAILNSDDVFHPERLATMAEAFHSDPTLDAAATGLRFIDADGRVIENPWHTAGMAFYHETGDMVLALINANILMTTSNLMIRRRALDDVGGFAPLRYVHDLDFFLRLALCGRAPRLIERPLLDYRFHARNTIGEGTAKVAAERAIVTAFHLDHMWKRPSQNWDAAANYVRALIGSGLSGPVLLCMAYLRDHPSERIEDNAILTDEAFRRGLAAAVGAGALPSRGLSEVEAELAEMRRSSSWQLTAPLRWLRRRLPI